MTSNGVITIPAGERPPLLSQEPACWSVLIDKTVHPLKVAIVEALAWVGGPLSAKELWLLDVGDPKYGNVAYHLTALIDLEVLKRTHESPARGSAEKFYVLVSAAAVSE
jgi:hypothetical protein